MNTAAMTQSSSGRILVVDDELPVRKLLAAMLIENGLACDTAAGGEEALRVMEQEPVDAVLADLHMPGLSGLQLLELVRPRYPEVAFLVITGEDDVRVGIEAMKNGADDYLVKPLHLDSVFTSLQRALEKKTMQRQLDRYKQDLEVMVQERTVQLESTLQQLEKSYSETLRALGTAIDLRDSPTAGHSRRVALYSLKLATELALNEQEIKTVAMGAWLHDVGKLAIPDAILLKPGSLTEEEWRVMRGHAQIGFDLVKQIPFLHQAAEIILTHHERWDGSGYPRGLKATEIPLGARIFGVADTVDAMTSDRPYRSALPLGQAFGEIQHGMGRRYDSRVATAFLSVPSEAWEAIRLQGENT